jgi:hypothetical protein
MTGINTCLDFRENTNKQLSEIRKTTQNMKEEFINRVEILKKFSLKF